MIPNFYPVEGLRGFYRGGQPIGDDFDFLRSLSIGGVVKLNTDAEGSDDFAVPDIAVFKCPINFIDQVITKPDPYTVRCTIDFVRASSYPIFIHCGSTARSQQPPGDKQPDDRGGNDRTSWMVALLQLLLAGWTPEQAWAGMLKYNYHWEELGLDWAWENRHVYLPKP